MWKRKREYPQKNHVPSSAIGWTYVQMDVQPHGQINGQMDGRQTDGITILMINHLAMSQLQLQLQWIYIKKNKFL